MQEDDKITIIGEIAKNIIKQGKEKLNQILNYIKIISIMNTIKKSKLVDDEKYKEICNDYKCANDTEKILLIITNGDYAKLKNIMSFIKELFLENNSSPDFIKEKISNYIESNKVMFGDETNLASLKDNIYCNYLLFDVLKKNEIKFALLYIGDITSINYEEIYKSILKKEEKVIMSENKEKMNIKNIKNIYSQLKVIIKNFEKNLSNSTTLTEDELNPIFKEMFNPIENIYTSQKCTLFKKIYRNIKFDAFIYYQDSILSIRDCIDKSPAMNLLNSHFNLKEDILSEKETKKLINKVIECPEKYGRKIIFLVYDINYYRYEIQPKYSYFPPIIKNIYYKKLEQYKIDNNKIKTNVYKVGFDFPYNFFDNLPFKACINKIFDKELKKTKNLFTKDSLLLKENISQKIIFDLNNLFQQNNKEYTFTKIIEKAKFNILIPFHKQALDLFESINGNIDIKIRQEIISNISSKLDKLIDNILSFNMYTIIFNKIEQIIIKITIDYFKHEIQSFKANPYEMSKYN